MITYLWFVQHSQTLLETLVSVLALRSDVDFSVLPLVLVDFQPPPPELGYTVTAKDLDEEKRAGISKIQKVLEMPGE